MARIYNDRGMEATLKTDGKPIKFFKYTTGTVQYDATTQEPVNPHTIVTEFADVVDFSLAEIANSGGLVDLTSKKLIVRANAKLEKGDDVLDADELPEYRIVLVLEKANRKILYASMIQE